ncbi:hypothetical protein LSAT2_014119 [Lamellibrachia satsuma]|nr:hypothetical protein LSAT2_014119 [Lamellibrachia satsuma]
MVTADFRGNCLYDVGPDWSMLAIFPLPQPTKHEFWLWIVAPVTRGIAFEIATFLSVKVRLLTEGTLKPYDRFAYIDRVQEIGAPEEIALAMEVPAEGDVEKVTLVTALAELTVAAADAGEPSGVQYASQ